MQESIYKTEKYRYTAIRLIKDKRGIFGMPQINISADFECEITKDKGLYYETDGEIVFYIKHFIFYDLWNNRVILEILAEITDFRKKTRL